MSDNRKPNTATAVAEPSAEKRKFVFTDYTDNSDGFDPTDITGYLKDGADTSGYHFDWVRHTNHAKAQSRYFVPVKPDTHGDLFKANAFDPIHGLIGRGQQYMSHTMGGIPELSLWVRPVEADIAEKEQMNKYSQRRLDPAYNEELSELQNRMGKVIGAEHVRSTTTTSRSGWGNN